jgi:riboflavin synthase
MFTGLIREIAKVESFSNNILTIKSKYTPSIGDSIAINGACLTVIDTTKSSFKVELSPETTKTLAIDNYKNSVHIEPAMAMGDRLDGHMVQGHIDCVGEIIKIDKNGNSYDVYIKIPQEFIKYVIPKGSIAVDGVSLTTNDVYNDSFRLTIIPLTFNETLFGSYKIGAKVNIETDLFARYIYNMFSKESKNSISWSDVDRVMARF